MTKLIIPFSRLLISFFLVGSLLYIGSVFTSPSSFAHLLIPQDIMDDILENPDITDEEIDKMFEDRYQMTVNEYQEKKAREEEEEYQQALKNDPQLAAYVKSLEEGSGYSEILTKSSREAVRKDEELKQKTLLKKIQEKEVSSLLNLRKNIKSEINTKNTSSLFLEKTHNSILAGVLHIWGGIDHILFFLSLILVARPFKKTLTIISIFTLAHSITLFLVGAQILSINSQMIEVMIALSIVYSAIFAGISLLKKPKQKLFPSSDPPIQEKFWDKNLLHTLAIVFLFGLFHGMGFAEVFQDFNFQFSQYWSALLFFNGGVEIGQISLLLLFYPLVQWLHKSHFGKAFLVVFSGIISLSALFWVIERIQGVA